MHHVYLVSIQSLIVNKSPIALGKFPFLNCYESWCIRRVAVPYRRNAIAKATEPFSMNGIKIATLCF